MISTGETSPWIWAWKYLHVQLKGHNLPERRAEKEIQKHMTWGAERVPTVSKAGKHPPTPRVSSCPPLPSQ